MQTGSATASPYLPLRYFQTVNFYSFLGNNLIGSLPQSQYELFIRAEVKKKVFYALG